MVHRTELERHAETLKHHYVVSRTPWWGLTRHIHGTQGTTAHKLLLCVSTHRCIAAICVCAPRCCHISTLPW
jgi:hypothetical protein